MTIKRSQQPHSSTLYSCILFIECCQWTRSTSDLFSIVVSVLYNVYYIRRGNPFRAPINLYRHSINAIRMFAVTLKLQQCPSLSEDSFDSNAVVGVAIAESEGEQNLNDFTHNKTHTLYATYHPPPSLHCRLMPQSSWHVVQVVVVFYFGLCALYTNRRGILRE